MTAPVDDDTSRKLGELSSRARAARTEAGLDPRPAPARGSAHGSLGMGLRVAFELSVSVGLGGVLGYAADEWLGSDPWGMVVGLAVGFASGVLTVYRVANGYDRVMRPGRTNGETPVEPSDEKK